MFKKLHESDGAGLTIEIDGTAVGAGQGESVAAVLLRQSEPWSRISPMSGGKRAPYCMMGVCFECVAEVDGVGSVQTCLKMVGEGMRVARQTRVRRIGN